MTTIQFSEYDYWSVIHDAEMTRISVTDANNREYFAIVPSEGKGYRQRRDEAIEHCLTAIRQGSAPGEVRWRT